MQIGKKELTCLLVFALFLFVSAYASVPVSAHASVPIYVAVPDGDEPGIWRMEDRNGDGDALDAGETTLFAIRGEVKGFMDVAVDEKGILYAIDGETGRVYRIEDLNGDGDALDAGEVGVFRDGTTLGLRLQGPLSIAVANHFDPDTRKIRALVYVMDLTLQLTVRLEDRDGDGDAQGSDEICVIQETTWDAPFTASRMTVDELGRVIACNPNNRWVVRLDDRNWDCHVVEPEEEPRCPPAPCGPSIFEEYHVIRKPASAPNLIDPFGVALSSKGNYFASELENREFRVVKLTDRNEDDDASDAGEASIYYSGEKLRGFDVVVDDKDIIYVAEENGEKIVFVITRLEDLNGDGDANDPGEFTLYADFTGIGVPFGLAAQLPPQPLLAIDPHLIDSSPLKGPLLVVEDGVTETLTLRVVDRATSDPAAGVRVGSQVLAGCFALCPLSQRTDAGGMIKYVVTRTAASPEGGETLKFWVYGDEVLIPVVSCPCTPEPVADPGPGRQVFTSQNVTLDGSASIGECLQFCWNQTEGPDVGLPNCTEEVVKDPTVTFTAPASPATLKFALHVRNACDYNDTAEVTIEVVEPSCPAEVALEGESRESDLQTLRRFRDEVLATSPIGRIGIRLYYKHSPEIVKMLLLDSDLKSRTREVFEEIMPGIRGLLDEGPGQEMVLSKDKVEKIDALLNDISERASPKLRVSIKVTKWFLKRFEGKTFQEIKSLI